MSKIMYNKLLDTFIAVAENGSFSKASEQLFISHTAVIKQINLLENHFGVKLVRRSAHGILLTAAGHQLQKETIKIMQFSEDALRRIQDSHFASPQTFKVGTSILYPCNDFMDLWEKINEQYPQYQLKMVPFTDDEKRLSHLNESCDFLVGPFNDNYEKKGLRFFPIGNYCFSLCIPRKHHLGKRKRLELKDLDGENLMIMKAGNSPINDLIRNEIKTKYPKIKILDISPHYSISTFNNCAKENCILLSLECWKNVHPSLTNVKLTNEFNMPYGIILPSQSDEKIEIFVKILQAVL